MLHPRKSVCLPIDLFQFQCSDYGNEQRENDAVKKIYSSTLTGRGYHDSYDKLLFTESSGYNQYDILAKILVNQSPNVNHTFNFQYSNTNDIPRYDRLNTINTDRKLHRLNGITWTLKEEFSVSYKLTLST